MRFELSAHLYRRLRALAAPGADRRPDGLREERTPTGPRYYITARDLESLGEEARRAFYGAQDSWRLLPDNAAAPGDADGALAPLFGELAARGTERFALSGKWLDLGFDCDRPPDALARFLAPYYELRPVPAARRCAQAPVRLWQGAALFEQAHALWQQLDFGCWSSARDRGVVAARGEGYAFYKTRGGALIGRFRYPRLKDGEPVIFLREAAGEPWQVLTEPGCTESDINAARSLRALASHKAAMLGAIAIHASCFVVGGQAFLVCGEKGTGKTTNLITALEALPEAQFLSNDRVFLWGRGGGLAVAGSPHSIPIRLGTFLVNDRLFADAAGGEAPGAGRGYSIRLDLSGRAAVPRGQRALRSDEEVYYAPSELAGVFGKTVVPDAPLGGIIFLGENPAGGGRAAPFVPVSPGTARRWLPKHLHSHYEEASPYWTDLLPRARREPGAPALPHKLDGVRFWALTATAADREVWQRFRAATVDA